MELIGLDSGLGMRQGESKISLSMETPIFMAWIVKWIVV